MITQPGLEAEINFDSPFARDLLAVRWGGRGIYISEEYGNVSIRSNTYPPNDGTSVNYGDGPKYNGASGVESYVIPDQTRKKFTVGFAGRIDSFSAEGYAVSLVNTNLNNQVHTINAMTGSTVRGFTRSNSGVFITSTLAETVGVDKAWCYTNRDTGQQLISSSGQQTSSSFNFSAESFTFNSVCFGVFHRSNVQGYFNGVIGISAIWLRGMEENEMRQWLTNPWDLLR